jgi:exopolysaccharide/PEP-CTERM locus tyrosine autokinase
MSIVERALQKSQAQRARTDPSNATEPQEFPEPTAPGQPGIQPAGTATLDEGERVAVQGRPVGIDLGRLRREGRLAPDALAYQTEEEFRRIKWPVLNAIFGREGAPSAVNNVVLVTSAIPGEGKTFTALNLALSLAREPDLDVLLVDGDVAQPALTRTLGLSDERGLTDLVADPTLDADAVIHPTSIERLCIVPAGARRDNSPELLASARMASVVAELSKRMSPGVVLFDSPPILATNEAQVLSRYAGQILMVVMADSTEQRVVTEALALLDRSKPINAVLNRVESSLVSRYYSHYYYGYGRGDKK